MIFICFHKKKDLYLALDHSTFSLNYTKDLIVMGSSPGNSLLQKCSERLST
jgi:hypothetical protein